MLIEVKWGKWLLAGLTIVSLGALSTTAYADTQNVQDNANVLSAKTERYPKLESNKNVQVLMTQLEGTENRIATERQNYISDVRAYNQSIVNFPSSMVANMKGAKPISYYQADKNAQTAPKVNLDN